MKVLKNMAALLVAMLLSLPLCASDEQYWLLATTRTSTMQKELDAAAVKGYRLAFASGLGGNTEIGVMMEKLPEGSPEKYSYRLLSTTNISTLRRRIDEAAREGYRVNPNAIAIKNPAGTGREKLNNSLREVIVIMERDLNNSDKVYEYKFPAPTRKTTLHDEMKQAVNEGYTLIAFTFRGEIIAIMEREKR